MSNGMEFHNRGEEKKECLKALIVDDNKFNVKGHLQ